MWAAASGNHSIAPYCFVSVQERLTEPSTNGPVFPTHLPGRRDYTATLSSRTIAINLTSSRYSYYQQLDCAILL